jgi:hypothetical protein
MKTLRSLIFALFFTAVWAVPALAQTPLNLDIRKDFGYDLGSQIRGTFTLAASGPADLTSVTFLIDGQSIRQVSAAPFSVQFKTTDFPDGFHDLQVTGQTSAGQALTSPARRFEFISAAAQQADFSKVTVPLLGLVAAIFVVMMAVQFLTFRNRKREPVPLGAQRRYGLRGGAICSRCGRPIPLHLAAINLGIGTKLDFCENCGRYGILRVRSLNELRRAEADELKDAQPQTLAHEPTPEERLKQQLDSSRFEEMK